MATYETVYEKMMTLDWLAKRSEMMQSKEHDVFLASRGQGRILSMLQIQDGISTKDLAYLLGVRQQTLNEQLNKLEKNGYVVREPKKEDQRILVVKLTERGKMIEPRKENHEILDCLSQDELDSFEATLDKIIHAYYGRMDSRERNQMDRWENDARGRMGDEQFDRLMRRPPMPPRPMDDFHEDYGYPPQCFAPYDDHAPRPPRDERPPRDDHHRMPPHEDRPPRSNHRKPKHPKDPEHRYEPRNLASNDEYENFAYLEDYDHE